MELFTMNNQIKNQAEILQKMGIDKLNPMQEEAIEAINSSKEILILSQQGQGKPLHFFCRL